MDKKIVIIGAGITGLTTAWQLSQKTNQEIIILEKSSESGGLAATVENSGFTFDMGSHRIHEQYAPEALSLIKELIGDALVKRPRKGQIYLNGKMHSYPPSMLHLFSSYSKRDSAQFIADFVKASIKSRINPQKPHDFESYVSNAIGLRLYESFYKPYALKLWGLPPSQISYEPAKNRLKKFCFKEMLNDIKKTLTNKTKRHYYYPASGIGAIGCKIEKRLTDNGIKVLYNTAPLSYKIDRNLSIKSLLFEDASGKSQEIETQTVISTIPMHILHEQITLPSDKVTKPKFNLSWRGLRLLHLITPNINYSENETFYIPDPKFLIGRVSELNKYSPQLNVATGLTGLTLEIPCSPEDSVWSMSDKDLAQHCVKELFALNILSSSELSSDSKFHSNKIPHLYPIYKIGWKDEFNKVFNYVHQISNLYTIGRSALFLHCNIDHCMVMGSELATHLTREQPSKQDWVQQVNRKYFDFYVRE
ncbi:MAG: protoporphyrinogen oxidase [Candidatus Omnitrophota bacterium]|jgi:protoporphyrinogen oxidase